MNHPEIASKNGHLRYSQMLQEAENHRRVKQIRREKFGKALGSLLGRTQPNKGRLSEKTAESPA
jgi:hypothetical protein